MPTTEELLQKINRLEEQIAEQIEKDNQMIEKSERAAEFAMHAYRVDHCGFIWVWDIETQDYKKTNMRIMSPELADRSVKSQHIAEGAVLSSKMGDGQILSCHIAPGEVKSRNIGDKQVLSMHILPGEIKSYHIAPEAIRGDDFDTGIPNGKLANNAVTSRNIRNGAVLPEKLDPNLLNEIRSAGEHGYALTGLFGDSNLIGIHQKAITEAFNRIWSKLEDITGEALLGISMTVSPEYFIGEQGCSVNITADTVDTNGIFEHIAFYNNGALIAEADGVDHFDYNFTIYETSVIKCIAKIMGIEYTRQKAITHYNSFWLGAGLNYQSIMNVSNVIPIANGMRGAYNRNVHQGQRIFVVVGESLASGFIRADINGVEIIFNETTVTYLGNKYKVFTSENVYQEGEYNIDING